MLQQVNFRLDERDRSLLRRLAKADRCTKTEIVRKALRLLHSLEAHREAIQRRTLEAAVAAESES